MVLPPKNVCQHSHVRRLFVDENQQSPRYEQLSVLLFRVSHLSSIRPSATRSFTRNVTNHSFLF